MLAFLAQGKAGSLMMMRTHAARYPSSSKLGARSWGYQAGRLDLISIGVFKTQQT